MVQVQLVCVNEFIALELRWEKTLGRLCVLPRSESIRRCWPSLFCVVVHNHVRVSVCHDIMLRMSSQCVAGVLRCFSLSFISCCQRFRFLSVFPFVVHNVLTRLSSLLAM